MKNSKNKIIKDVQFLYDVGSMGNLIELPDGRGYKSYIPVCKSGIQEYFGYEVDSKRFGYDNIVNVYRPEDEVSNPESMATLEHIFLTNEHPYEDVNVENAKQYVVGEGSTDAVYNAPFIWQTIYIKDIEGIGALVANKRQVSCGYLCDIEIVSGTFVDENGVTRTYQAIQRNIRYNHIALVEFGRMQSPISIGDKASVKTWQIIDRSAIKLDEATTADSETIISNKKEIIMDMKKVFIGDKKAVDVLATDADKLELHLDTMKKDSDQALESLQTKHDTAMELKDKELTKKDEEIKELKEKQVDAVDLDALVSARAEFVASAKTLKADVKTDGLTEREIKLDVLCSKLPKTWNDETKEKKTDESVDDAFLTLLELVGDAKPELEKDTLAGKTLIIGTPSDAKSEFLDGLKNSRKESK